MAAPLFISGIVIGLFLGAILWEVLYAGPTYRNAREREWRLAESVLAWKRMYLYAEGARMANSKAMFKAVNRDPGADITLTANVEPDTFSRKVTDLTVVK